MLNPTHFQTVVVVCTVCCDIWCLVNIPFEINFSDSKIVLPQYLTAEVYTRFYKHKQPVVNQALWTLCTTLVIPELYFLSLIIRNTE